MEYSKQFHNVYDFSLMSLLPTLVQTQKKQILYLKFRISVISTKSRPLYILLHITVHTSICNTYNIIICTFAHPLYTGHNLHKIGIVDVGVVHMRFSYNLERREQ